MTEPSWECEECGAARSIDAWPLPCENCGSRVIVGKRNGTSFEVEEPDVMPYFDVLPRDVISVTVDESLRNPL